MILSSVTYSPARYSTPGRKRGGVVYPADTIVLHWTAGAGEGDDLTRYLKTERQASYHFAISRDGSVWQYVDTDDTAWHAGPYTFKGARINPRSIGVALCNRGPVTPAWAQQHPDLVWHGTHPKRGFSWRAFERYTPDQSAALAALLAQLVSVHPLHWVVGHEDVTPAKGDPGPALSLLGLNWGALGLQRLHRDWTSADTWRPGDRPLGAVQAAPPPAPGGRIVDASQTNQGAPWTASQARPYLGPLDALATSLESEDEGEREDEPAAA